MPSREAACFDEHYIIDFCISSPNLPSEICLTDRERTFNGVMFFGNDYFCIVQTNRPYRSRKLPNTPTCIFINPMGG